MKWDDFINPRSMLTPGVAGIIVMVIANTFWVEFMVPQKWTALLLSFIFVIPILIRFPARNIERIVYFIFNGLIIFSLSINTNFAGQKIQEISVSNNKILSVQENPPSHKAILRYYATDKGGEISPNRLKLALNETQPVSLKYIADVTQQTDKKNDQTNSSTSRKQSVDKEKNKPPQENTHQRKFFGNWF